MNHIYLACRHDKYREDVFIAFTDEEKAKGQCYQWHDLWKQWNRAITEPKVTTDYGDWCLFFSDDYYCFVQKVEVVSDEI